MTIHILVEDREVFAKLNYLRDLTVDDEVSPWNEEADLYLLEANSDQVLEHYVLTNEEIDKLSVPYTWDHAQDNRDYFPWDVH
jgi:hypothetical protein